MIHMYSDNYYPEDERYDHDENTYYSGQHTFLMCSLINKNVYKYTDMGETRDADFFCDVEKGDGNYNFNYRSKIFDGDGEGTICWENENYTIKELMWFAV